MIEHVMPLCLTISWVYTVAMLTQSIVYEKEQRLKEVSGCRGVSGCNRAQGVRWISHSSIDVMVNPHKRVTKCSSFCAVDIESSDQEKLGHHHISPLSQWAGFSPLPVRCSGDEDDGAE